MNPQTSATKTALRRELRCRRAQLDEAQSASLSAQIADRALQHLEQRGLLKSGARIALYLANAHETKLDALIEKLQAWNVEVFAPHFEEGQRAFYSLAPSGENIKATVFSGIQLRAPAEYSGGVACSAQELDAILVPGLGFDENGNRIGQGGGWYDRVLADATRVLKMGIAFDFQISHALPRDAHDQRMDVVITEKRTVNVQRPRQRDFAVRSK